MPAKTHRSSDVREVHHRTVPHQVRLCLPLPRARVTGVIGMTRYSEIEPAMEHLKPPISEPTIGATSDGNGSSAPSPLPASSRESDAQYRERRIREARELGKVACRRLGYGRTAGTIAGGSDYSVCDAEFTGVLALCCQPARRTTSCLTETRLFLHPAMVNSRQTRRSRSRRCPAPATSRCR